MCSKLLLSSSLPFIKVNKTVTQCKFQTKCPPNVYIFRACANFGNSGIKGHVLYACAFFNDTNAPKTTRPRYQLIGHVTSVCKQS